jgi:hypothetical protein
MNLSNKFSTILASVVVAVWAISMIVDMIPQAAYEPPVAIYPALMLVLGGVFGIKIVKGNNGGT